MQVVGMNETHDISNTGNTFRFSAEETDVYDAISMNAFMMDAGTSAQDAVASNVVLGVVSCPNVPPGDALERFTAQIAAHVQYHVSIGLSAVLMYARSNMLGALAHADDIQALILSKKLFLIKCASSPLITVGCGIL